MTARRFMAGSAPRMAGPRHVPGAPAPGWPFLEPLALPLEPWSPCPWLALPGAPGPAPGALEPWPWLALPGALALLPGALALPLEPLEPAELAP